MKYNYVGNTGLMVSELCFGTMTFGGQEAGMWNNIGQFQQKEVNKMLETVISSGINFIDTADVYSFGQAEQSICSWSRFQNVSRRHN
jgi:aryl-alcohol dehydrogenase-like predicted oxidoreductase